MYAASFRVLDILLIRSQAQYGNILRLMPSGESPLLLPQNEHKRLVVIDFEYANANPRGLEFANHFTEWCYNYHAEKAAFGCNTKAYPTREEQARFLAAYASHRPNLPWSSSTPGTPFLGAAAFRDVDAAPLPPAAPSSSASSISGFMMEARTPGNVTPTAAAATTTGASSMHASASAPALAGAGSAAGPLAQREFVKEDEAARRQRDDDVQREVEALLRETRRWRLACSAQWVMWGVMQAKISGAPEAREDEARLQGEAGMGELRLPDSGFVDGDGDGVGVGAKADGAFERVGWDYGTDQRSPEIAAMAESARDKRPQDAGDAEEDFDYLGYSRERALFFWGDAVLLGLVKREDLPEGLREEIRTVDY